MPGPHASHTLCCGQLSSHGRQVSSHLARCSPFAFRNPRVSYCGDILAGALEEFRQPSPFAERMNPRGLPSTAFLPGGFNETSRDGQRTRGLLLLAVMAHCQHMDRKSGQFPGCPRTYILTSHAGFHDFAPRRAACKARTEMQRRPSAVGSVFFTDSMAPLAA